MRDPRSRPTRLTGCAIAAQLWNAIEKAEKRKDSQLARSLDIALPHELKPEQNLELVRDFVRAEFVDRGMIADLAIHAPGRKGDHRNVHAHILLTTREIAGPGFGPKARDWNSKQELQQWRQTWAEHANRILEREGFEERIDHRSLLDQGIDREPTTHVGPAGKKMEERGNTSDRAQRNRDIKAANDDLELAEQDLAQSETRLAELKQQLAAERMGRIQKSVRAADTVWEEAEQRWAPKPERAPESGAASCRQTARTHSRTRPPSPTTRAAGYPAGTSRPNIASANPVPLRRPDRPAEIHRAEQGGRAEARHRSRKAKPRKGRGRTKARPGTMMRSGVADQPERQIHRPLPALTGGLLGLFKQVAWLLTASNLASKLRTMWRVVAREMTEPHTHRSKRPRKAKAPRPF